MKALGKALVFVLLFAALVVIGVCIFKRIEFKQNCSGYLHQAADASTVEICLDRLTKAIDYVEARGWTEGYTSVLYKTEDENVGFWYQNLKLCQDVLTASVGQESLVQSNVLMRVREVLTDNGEKGTKLTIPDGLVYYPNNLPWALARLFAWIMLFGCYVAIKED